MNTELKTAYLQSGLWRQGKTFAQCLADALLRRQLERQANARRINAARRGEPIPQQCELGL